MPDHFWERVHSLGGDLSGAHKAPELGWSLGRSSGNGWKTMVTDATTGSGWRVSRSFIELLVNSHSLRLGEVSPFYR